MPESHSQPQPVSTYLQIDWPEEHAELRENDGEEVALAEIKLHRLAAFRCDHPDIANQAVVDAGAVEQSSHGKRMEDVMKGAGEALDSLRTIYEKKYEPRYRAQFEEEGENPETASRKARATASEETAAIMGRYMPAIDKAVENARKDYQAATRKRPATLMGSGLDVSGIHEQLAGYSLNSN